MPLFARRRLATMIKDVQSFATASKINNLVTDLELPDTKKALAAEAELAIVWAVSQRCHCFPEPKLSNNREPDLISNDLFPSGPAIIEVRAVSDYSFSGAEAMNRTANIIVNYADQIGDKLGKHLYFTFRDHSGWDKSGKFFRRRCVDPQFRLSKDFKHKIREWVKADNWSRSNNTLMLQHGETHLQIEWRSIAHPHGRTFCSMPALAYDIEKNPIYRALSKKLPQIRSAPHGTLRCVLLFDTGCRLLRNIGRQMSSDIREIPAEDIISHTLRKHSLDRVIVFSAKERNSGILMARRHTRQLYWDVTVFDLNRDINESELQNLRHVARTLPPPRFEGYQANQLHRQGSFNHEKNRWYLGAELKSNPMKQTFTFSSRMLLDYLAGNIDVESFDRDLSLVDMNIFRRLSNQGYCISSARIIPAGADEDDDLIELELELDFAQTSLKTIIKD
tara:strand:+ start:4009 stop:5355 length:1347 start_codon:yes stop_codon:yes gene_type:complete